MPKIERLRIENYRGASTLLELTFDKDKPVTVVFGENGTGKTTIVDALDVIGNCSKGSLEDKSSTRARDHLPTIGKKPNDVRIEGVSGASTWKATLTGDNFTTIPELRPKIQVLRRSHLQRLIEAEPAKRYEALRRFIDVNNVERSENTLRDASSQAKADFDSAVKRRVDAESQLIKIWEAEGKPKSNSLEWAETVVSQDIAKIEQEVQQLRSTYSIISKAETALSEWRQASLDVIQRQSEAQAIEKEVAELPGVDAQQAMGLAGILKDVGQHLQAGDHPDECPVCMQGIPLDKLKADIQTRLAALKQYEELQIKSNTATRNTQVSEEIYILKTNVLITSSTSLIEIIQKGEIEIINTMAIKLLDYPELTNQDSSAIDVATKEAEQLITILSGQKHNVTDTGLALSKQSGQVNSIKVQYEQVLVSIKSTERLEKLHISLDEAYNTVRLTRIEFTQKILNDIASECNRLYAGIHPKEPIAISKLELDVGKRASLNQAASFEGHNDVPPQAYFSESHLDTLGFCFWLALVKRDSPNADAVIVLDDVFTSVDAQHINRIAQLITDESKYFSHVIITTHQRLWRDIYRYQHGAGKVTQMIELQHWSLSKGISNFKTKLAVDELIDFISAAPFDRQITASKSGVLLEAVLDYLALQYRCRVARTHDGSYTLGELLDGTESLFKKLEVHRPDVDAAGQPFTPPKYTISNSVDILNQLRSLVFLRNQVGAHFNLAGSAVPDTDVQQFADLTVKLAESLSCKTCGQIPGKKMTTYFKCSCSSPLEVMVLPLQL
ncbi:AAA family ATPase [Methylotenera sp.]|uniref:AAA family ATPase n=1 Tax=Methylotenera sp. TaxID=2051956 RepID=UPI0025D79793|nr:AAA family ATPase [Methylotenera sp.]